MKNADGGFRLPEEIDPQRIQFCIEIPNDLNHIIAFWGTLRELTKWWNWQRDDAHTALLVTDVWDDVIDKARASFAAGDCLSPELCQDYRPTSARLTWFPENPYHPEPEPPDPFIFHPFTVVDGSILGTIISLWGLGYEIGDVYTDITKALIVPMPGTVIDAWLNLPGFIITDLHGNGTVKIHLLNIPQGGRAFIQIDNDINPFNWHIVELNKDLVSFPQETQVPIVVEIKIDTDGDHEIKVTFAPTVDDTFLPIFFGGGFRGFELCGFGVVPMPTEPCCDETNTLLRKIVLMMEGGMNLTFNAQNLPDDFRVDCSPSDFDKNEGETDEEILANRATALCLMVARYILSVLYYLGKRSNFSTATKTALLALMDIDAPPDFYPQLVMGNLDSVTLTQIARIAGTETTAFENVLCAMLDGLQTKHNTFDRFKNSLVDEGVDAYTDVETHWLTEFIVAFNQKRENYNVFARELEKAFDEVTDGFVYECPCVEDPEECLTITLVNGNPTTFPDTIITNVVGNTWRIQNASTDTTGFGVCGASIKDVNGCCFDTVANPEGYATQGTNQYQNFYCDGTDSGVHTGGGGGNCLVKFSWDQGDATPVDTYVTIVPHVGDIC